MRTVAGMQAIQREASGGHKITVAATETVFQFYSSNGEFDGIYCFYSGLFLKIGLNLEVLIVPNPTLSATINLYQSMFYRLGTVDCTCLVPQVHHVGGFSTRTQCPTSRWRATIHSRASHDH